MKAAFCILASLVLLLSCRKHMDTSSLHLLGVASEERIIRIKQAVLIYDSTALRDSIDFVKPPPGKNYQWKITPADKDIYFGDYYHNGRAEIIFYHSGTYRISADIYDTISLDLVAHTNTVTITVTTDTLHPSWPLQPGDSLYIRIGLGGTGGVWNSVNLQYHTAKSYDYYFPYTQLSFTSQHTGNNFSFVSADSVQLVSYPFAYGYNIHQPAEGSLSMGNMPPNTPAGLSITWQGKTYTGTFTLSPSGAYDYKWDNSGAVRIVP